jgi:hypothetical protein
VPKVDELICNASRQVAPGPCGWVVSVDCLIPLGKTSHLFGGGALLPGLLQRVDEAPVTVSSQKNSTESLILAQDERWRRA